MGDPAPGPTPDDRLTQMVQAAVSASLARRSSILKPREIQELTADARAQLDELIRRRDADLQRLALLERAREKLQEEITGIQGKLAGNELRLDEGRRGAARVEQRLAGMERETEGLRGEVARKLAEAEEADARARHVSGDVERLRTEATALPVGAPSRGELEARARQLQAQVTQLLEAREVLRRELAGLQEALGARDRELELERAALRDAREREAELARVVTALGEEARQKRSIEVKVYDEMTRAQAGLVEMAERVAELERSAEQGPVVAELRKELERVREEGRADRVQVAHLLAQLRDQQDVASRSTAAAQHLRDTLAGIESERDRLDELVRKERRSAAERQRVLSARLEELEARPPVGSDPASWERVKAQFEARLKEAARRTAELERESADMRSELENARALLTRATLERQQLRARVEALELASVSSPTDKMDALRAELRQLELERDEAKRDGQVLRSRLEAMEGKASDLARDRERLEGELRDLASGGLFTRLGRAIRGS